MTKVPYKTLQDWIDEKGWEKQDVDQNLQKLYRFADMIRLSTYYKEYALNVGTQLKKILINTQG